MATELRELARVSIHPTVRNDPEWEAECPRFQEFVRDVHERGFDAPLVVDGQDRVVDGRKRYRAARQLRLETVPVRVIGDEEIPITVIQSLLQRRHLSLSARAYLAWPLMEGAVEAARRRKMQSLRKGQQSPVVSAGDYGNAGALAEALGIGRNLFFEAQKVHEIFGKDKEFREQMEPRILQEFRGGEHEDSRPVGLGSVIAGYGGRNKGGARKDHGQLELFTDGFGAWVKRCSYWAAFDEEERAQARRAIRASVAAMPQEVRVEVAMAIKQAGVSTTDKHG
jgi:hypothetical protein